MTCNAYNQIVGTDSGYLIPSYINEPEEDHDIVQLSAKWGRNYFMDTYPKLNRNQSEE